MRTFIMQPTRVFSLELKTHRKSVSIDLRPHDELRIDFQGADDHVAFFEFARAMRFWADSVLGARE